MRQAEPVNWAPPTTGFSIRLFIWLLVRWLGFYVDIAIVRGPRKRYFERHPYAPDIGLLVEVAESTLHQDRNFKAPLYGRAGIVAYWIVNISDSRIEVHTEPFESGYRTVRNYGLGESVSFNFDGMEIGHITVTSLFAE